MNSVIIGGTAGVGREIAEALAVRGHTLLITGKDRHDVETSVANLQIRYGVKVSGLAVDATSHENYLNALADAGAKFGSINNLFFPIGSSNELDNGGLDVKECAAIISSNFMSVVLAIKALSAQFHQTERITVIGFSSIAAIRGRSENVIYSASKKALESYFESLKMIYLNKNIVIKYYRLGYIDTHQSYGKNLLFPKINPKRVATHIVSNLNSKWTPVYYPLYWGVITILIRALPISFYKKVTS